MDTQNRNRNQNQNQNQNVKVDTLIVGGGISGLACARALNEAGHDFRLVTDRLGGRMLASEDGLNLGAAYITSDYHNVLRFAHVDHRVYMADVYFWDGDRFINIFSPRNLWRVVQLGRLYQLLYSFRKRIIEMRRRVPHVCQKELMESDPLLRRYTQQPATDLVHEHGLDTLNEIFCGPVFQSTLFVPWNEVNAFYYLANLFPAYLATYTVDLSGTARRMSAAFENRVHLAKVTAVEETNGGQHYTVKAGDSRYVARNLVLAVPGRNSNDLIPVECTARDVPYATLHIRGIRREQYKPGKTVFLRPEHPIRVLWPQRNGLDITFGPETEPDLSAYYHEYEIVRAVYWKTAVQISDHQWRPLRPKANLYTIGDHNIVGLEDSYLTGLFAANRILGA